MRISSTATGGWTLTVASLLTIKGAPEVLIERSTKYLDISGIPHSLGAIAMERISALKDEWSSRGRRVLLLAHKTISGSSLETAPSSAQFERDILSHAKSGLTIVGLVAIVDPPRAEIPDVIRTLRSAGIRVFMVGC